MKGIKMTSRNQTERSLGRGRRLALLASAGVSTLCLISASAQAAPEPNSVSEVLVTAGKRGDQRVMDVPGAIQAITGATLQKSGAASVIDIATKVPGLQLQDRGPGDKKYVIRGINSTGDSTTGVYYDEAVISGSNANDGGGREADIRLYDLDRIEVLRGPQGTLYGASSESGTIRFITKKPNLTGVDGYVTGEVSDTHKGGTNYGANGAINLPIIDNVLAARVVGWTNDDSGYIDQSRLPGGVLKDVNTDRTQGGRLTVLYAPTDNLKITASVTDQTTKSKGSSRYTPAGVMSFGDAADGYPPVPGGDLINTDLTRSPWHEHLDVYSLTGEYKFAQGTLTGTINQFKRDIDYSFDSTPILFSFGVPVPAATLEPQSRKVTSGEIRYASDFEGPLNFVGGVYGQRDETDLTVNVIRTNAFGLPAGPFSPLNSDDALINPTTGNTFFGRTDHRKTTSYAGFGELTWQVTDKFSLLGGFRYFRETLDGLQLTTHPFGGFGAAPAGSQANHDVFHKPTFKVTAKYKFDADLMVYATASEGFRGGGLNPANLPFASGIPLGFSPDSLWNYEVGAKGRLMDGLVTYDVAAYYIDWKDIQVSEVDATGAFPFTSNAGGARVYGLEGQVEIHPAEGLIVNLNGSYQNAQLTEDQPAIPGNPNIGHDGDRIPNVPRFQGSLSVEYTHPLTGDLDGTLAADIGYRGSTDTQLNTTSPFNVPLASYTLVNLRASISNELWTGTVFARNLTDERAQIDAISSTQDPLARLTVRPRTLGVSVTRKF
jgi:iron complex outermembrane receptor protein